VAGGNGIESQRLAWELMAALLADDFDLPVPKPYIVDVEQGFHTIIATPEVSKLAQNNVGLNFGSQRLPPGFGTWAREKLIPVLLRPAAAEIFAFNVLIPNADRACEAAISLVQNSGLPGSNVQPTAWHQT
jgi:hypothetical protein